MFSVERPPSKPGLVIVEQQLHKLKFLSPPCCTSRAPQSCAWRSQREECPAFLLPCQLHWHFLFCSQLHIRRRHHEVLFHVGSGGETKDPFWSEPPADVRDTFFTPLYATRQALVIIYCHRNHFLHAANCKSFRTAGRHCPGKGKDNVQGKVSGSKQNSVLQQQLPGERQGEMQQWLCGFSGN